MIDYNHRSIQNSKQTRSSHSMLPSNLEKEWISTNQNPKIVWPKKKARFIHWLILNWPAFVLNDLAHMMRHTINQPVNQFIRYSFPPFEYNLFQFIYIFISWLTKVDILYHLSPYILNSTKIWWLCRPWDCLDLVLFEKFHGFFGCMARSTILLEEITIIVIWNQAFLK